MKKSPTDRELAERHKYRLPNGDLAINVTAISGLMDRGKSGAFAGAAMKIATERVVEYLWGDDEEDISEEGIRKAIGAYRGEWKDKADRGTRVHSYLESFLNGDAIDFQDDESGFVDALERFIIDHDPTVIAQEEIVLSNSGWGGRFDLLCEIEGETVLLDAKTGSAYGVENCLQLAAYSHADGMAEYDEDGKLVRLRPLPKIDKCGCLYVRGDGTYHIVYYPADNEAYAMFLNLLSVFQWTRSDKIKVIEKAAKAVPR